MQPVATSISYITKDDLKLISQHLADAAQEMQVAKPPLNPRLTGVFYLIQLEPEHDPGRFKVGFASKLSERMPTHRCSAPMAIVLASWPCRPLWKKTAIDCLAQSCERIHTEVFRTDDIAGIQKRCEEFFALMPEID